MTGNAGSKEVMLGRGCFALDLGIDFILRTFWLRQDYMLYDHLPVPTMEAFAEEYKVHTFDYELMDMGRDTLGVSFLASTLFSSAHHPVLLVLSIMGSQRTNSNMPKKITRNMAALLVFAWTLLKIQIWSLSIVRAVKSQLPISPLTNCSKLLRTPVVSVCPTRGYQ